MLGHRNPWTSRSRGSLLALNRCLNLLERMLACLGQLQISRILSRSSYWNRDLYPCSDLWLQPIPEVRCGFNDDCVDRSHYRRFVSVLVCTFSSKAAAAKLVTNRSR